MARLGILLIGIFQDLEVRSHLIKALVMLVSGIFIFVEEQVQIDFLVKLETRVVLHKLLILVIVGDAINLEHHDVRRAANPGLEYLSLALFFALESLNFTFAARLPSRVKFTTALGYLQLYWPHLVNILLSNL